MEDEKRPSKNKWKRISQIMSDNKYNFSAEQCRLKIKSLKDRYAKQKKKNNTSGESPSEIDTQLEDCFESQPDIQPVATIDTGVDAAAPTTCTDDNDAEKQKAQEDEADASKPKKRRPSVGDSLKDFLKSESERREAAAEQRHQDRMNTANEMIGVLKVLAANASK